MRSVDLINKYQELPDVYTKADGSNNRKKWQVFAEALEDLNTVFGQIEEMEDLANVYGQTLDYFGVNYGVNRNGLSDNAYRALIFARRANTIGGNSVDRILEFLSFYVDMSRLSLVELWDVSANFFLDGTQNLDGTWELSSVAIGLFLDGELDLDGSWFLSGIPLSTYRGFYVQATGITSEERAILTSVLPFLKAGGIYGVIEN